VRGLLLRLAEVGGIGHFVPIDGPSLGQDVRLRSSFGRGVLRRFRWG